MSFFKVLGLICVTFVNLLLVNGCTTTADPQSITIVRNETKIFGKEATYTSHGVAQNQTQQQYSSDNNEIIQEDSPEVNEQQHDEKEHNANAPTILSGAAAANAASEHKNTSSKNLVKGEEDFDIKSMGKESKNTSKPSKTLDTNQSNLAENSKLSGVSETTSQSPSTFKTPTPLNSPDFEWPIKGNVIKHYSKKVGMQNEGINIAAPLNAPVSAAGDGTVVYTGSSDKYGNLIIVKHKDSYFSAYSHLNEIDVKSAQNVMKGDIIGKVGSTGEVDKPQLYFSMRKNKITIDPELMR